MASAIGVAAFSAWVLWPGADDVAASDVPEQPISPVETHHGDQGERSRPEPSLPATPVAMNPPQGQVVSDSVTRTPTKSLPESQPPRPSAEESKNTPSTDPRLRIRWGKTGLCADGEGLARLERRGPLLQGFKSTKVGDLQIAFDDSVRAEVLQETASTIQRTKQFANYLLGWSPQSFPPKVVVYRDLDQMLSVSCVNKAALGYYDGEIHISGSWLHGLFQIRQSAAHEYAHHVLNTMGVTKPMWLHEGMAMTVAEEEWWRDPKLGLQRWLEKEHLPFQALVDGFPHTADELFAGAAYYQSLMMVAFIRDRRGSDYFRHLLNELSSGAVQPSRAFSVAADLEGDPLEAAWNEFVKTRQGRSL